MEIVPEVGAARRFSRFEIRNNQIFFVPAENVRTRLRSCLSLEAEVRDLHMGLCSADGKLFISRVMDGEDTDSGVRRPPIPRERT